jgi:hypothetical protein
MDNNLKNYSMQKLLNKKKQSIYLNFNESVSFQVGFGPSAVFVFALSL